MPARMLRRVCTIQALGTARSIKASADSKLKYTPVFKVLGMFSKAISQARRTPRSCARKRGSVERTSTGRPSRISAQRASVSSSSRCIASRV